MRIGFGDLCRLVLGLVFLISGAYKLIDPVAFHISVLHMGMGPGPLHQAVVFGVPIVELAIGIMLIMAVLPAVAAGAAIAVLLLFSATLTVTFFRTGEVADCGCFPFPEPSSIGYYLIRNGFLILLSASVCAGRRGIGDRTGNVHTAGKRLHASTEK